MREIKFRAWDKNIEAMVDPEDLYLNGNGLAGRYYRNCDDEESIWATDPLSLEGIILMQYTGLKDKNGVEICEGDIVRGHPYSMHSPVWIYWDSGQCSFEARAGNWSSHFIDWSGPSDLNYQPFEIIGNIYENPELLKSKYGE